MIALFNAAAMAGLLTALFALRFRAWEQRWFLLGYFTLFFTADWAVQALWLPRDTLGPEIGAVCLAITALVLGFTRLVRHFEERARVEAGS